MGRWEISAPSTQFCCEPQTAPQFITSVKKTHMLYEENGDVEWPLCWGRHASCHVHIHRGLWRVGCGKELAAWTAALLLLEQRISGRS